MQKRCNKRKYTKLSKARGVRDKCQHHSGMKLYIYKCSNCKKYHLTKQSSGFNKKLT